MKRNLLITLIFILCIATGYTNKRDVIYVAATGGLSLREKPDSKSARIELLNYGTQITNYNSTEVYETIDGYSGTWLRIVVNGKDGYVFGGYTIPIAPPKKNTINVESYLEECFGKPKATDTLRNDQNTPILSSAFYNNCISYNFSYTPGEDRSYQYTILNLDMSVQEAFLLFCIMEENIIGGIFGEEERSKYRMYSPDKPRIPLKLLPIGLKNEDFQIEQSAWFKIIVNFMGNSRGYMRLEIFRIHEKTAILWGDYAYDSCK